MAREIRKEITGRNTICESLLDFERVLIREEIMASICRTILDRTLGVAIHLNVWKILEFLKIKIKYYSFI